MPTYKVRCLPCGYDDAVQLKIAELQQWDKVAICPQCGDKGFARYIASAPARLKGGAEGKRAFSSAARDDMRHEEHKRRNPDQIAAAVENVRKGAFENF